MKKKIQILLKQETLINLYMKLRPKQHCNATWIEFELNLDWNELNSNILDEIWIELNSNSINFNFNWNQLSSNSIEDKWNVNWWIKYWNFAHEFGFGKSNF